jgi:hypothetical protein
MQSEMNGPHPDLPLYGKERREKREERRVKNEESKSAAKLSSALLTIP